MWMDGLLFIQLIVVDQQTFLKIVRLPRLTSGTCLLEGLFMEFMEIELFNSQNIKFTVCNLFSARVRNLC